MSQRRRVLRIVALATLPLVVLTLVSLWQDTSAGEERTAAERVALAKAAALTTDAFVTGNLATVESLALIPALTNPGDTAQTARLLADLTRQNPDWDGMGLIDADGWNFVSSSSPPRTVNIADRPYFQRVLATGSSTASSAIIGRRSGLPTVILAAPVQRASGERAVLIVPLPTERLDENVRAQLGSPGLQVVVVDGQGQTLVHPDRARVAALTPLSGQPAVDAVLAGEAGSRIVSVNGVDRLVAYAPVPAYGWGVLIEEPTAVAFAPIRQAFVVRLGLLGLVVALVAGIGAYFGGRLSLLYDRLLAARAQADTARLAAEAAQQRAAFLAEASKQLASTLDYEATLQTVARLAASHLADWCSVHVVEPDGTLQRIAVAHADPTREPLLRELQERHPPEQGSEHPVLRVLRSGRSRYGNDLSETDLARGVPDAEHRALLRRVGIRAFMCVPMEARGHLLGAITLASAAAGPRFGPAELAVAEDLASRAALAIDNARLHHELQEAIRTRDEFVAAASHDLKNPLASIKGVAQVLQRRAAREGQIAPERLASGLASIDTAATRMSRLIDLLLDVARLQMGSPLLLEPHPTDLLALAEQVADECQQATERHTISVEGERGLIGRWDAARLERVLGNLLDNAIKYSPAGGEIVVRLARADDAVGGWAVLTVRDQGIGIPPADLPRIFDRFQRGGNVVGRIHGTGIGLAGARQIVEQHGGTIEVESEARVGTTVRVRLPLLDANC